MEQKIVARGEIKALQGVRMAGREKEPLGRGVFRNRKRQQPGGLVLHDCSKYVPVAGTPVKRPHGAPRSSAHVLLDNFFYYHVEGKKWGQAKGLPRLACPKICGLGGACQRNSPKRPLAMGQYLSKD